MFLIEFEMKCKNLMQAYLDGMISFEQYIEGFLNLLERRRESNTDPIQLAYRMDALAVELRRS